MKRERALPSARPAFDGGAEEMTRARRKAVRHGRPDDRLSLFTGDVARGAREVGTEGRPGGRAKVRGLSSTYRRSLGTWTVC